MRNFLKRLKERFWLFDGVYDSNTDTRVWISRPLRRFCLALVAFWRAHWVNLIQIGLSVITAALLYLQLQRM